MSPKNVYKDLPKNLTFDKGTARYRYRFPDTGKRTWMGSDKDKAIAKANKLNGYSHLKNELRVMGQVDPSFASVIDSYIEIQAPRMPWNEDTRVNSIAALELYKKQLGKLPLKLVDRVIISRWIETRGGNGYTKRKHRLRFVRLFDFAISQKWCDYNEAQATPKYSRSLKLAENKVLRKRMDLKTFWRIHDVSPLYIQVAMQLSLVTLQARQEILNMQRSDIRDGYIYVVRRKTATESDAAFIRIRVNPEIERILALSRSSGIASPYIVHRIPRSVQKTRKQNHPHPTWIKPSRFTTNFAYQRKKAGVTDEYATDEAPSFHEIRSLGARQMREKGANSEEIKLLLAHGDQKTSDIYLDGRDKVSDDRYLTVNAPLIISR